MKNVIAGLAATAVVLSLGACSAESPESGSWTILAYSIADTDLEPYMMDDLDEMGAAGGQDGLDIVALVDRAADYGDDEVLGLEGWEGAKYLHVVEDGAEELEDLGDVNTGDPDLLAEFIARGVTDYPADNYALVISDHGASWPGVGGDESSDDDTLTLAEIDEGVGAGLAEAGLDRLDLLGFDACLMATYEVASALAPRADRLLASQELEPGHGWDYSVLADLGSVDVDTLGSTLIDGFAAQAVGEQTETEITLSLIDLTGMAAVDAAVADFSGQLVDRVAGVAPTVGRTLAQTLGFGRSPDPDSDSFMTDLGILAGEIGVDALDVSDAADSLVRSINDVVIDKVDGQATRGATGLSIYFPPTVGYYQDDYAAAAPETGWAEFLTAYYGAGAAISDADRPSIVGDAEIVFEDGGVTIRGAFDVAVANVAETYIRYGTVAGDGTITYLGQEEAAIAEDGTAEGWFDLTTLEITDGEDAAPAYLELARDEEEDIVTFDVPMAYYPPGSDEYTDVVLTITLDEDGNVIGETYYSYNADLQTYGELTTDPAGVIVPQVLTVSPDGSEQWTATSDTGLWADLPALQYGFPSLASGTVLQLELWVVDFGGNAASVSAVVTLP